MIGVLVAASAVVGATTVQDLVNQVSQANYTDYLNNLLYAHRTDNRFLTGPQHDPCADNVFITFRCFGWTTLYDPFAASAQSDPTRNSLQSAVSLYGNGLIWHNINDTVDTTGYIDYAYGTKFVRCIVGWLATSAELIQ